MTKAEAVQLAGSVTALAKVFGISRSAVAQWDAIPEGRLYQLKVIRPHWFRKPKTAPKRQVDAV